ncbi:MAG: hypothetical protein J0I09_10400 [Sphingobacteriia bacterium]|nr:hypothetical protein [Sphingobacteriia bacterium]
MKNASLLISVISFLSCHCPKTKNTVSKPGYPVRDYVLVGKMMDTVKTPYIIDVAAKNKRVVFIGCVHDVDSTHPQFKIIEKYFDEVKPQIAFNEGGQIPDSIHYVSFNDALKRDGETGVLKYNADKSGIKMMNGDMDAKTELALTLRKLPKEELFLYYVMERIAIPYHYGAYKDESFDTVFNRIIHRYFIKNGFPLSDKETDLSYFKTLYEKETKRKFNTKDLDLEAFDYVNDNCKYCAVGRVSKMTRDSVLLSKIDAALNKYDRVMVTFGHGHALAIEPALKEIIKSRISSHG